MRQQIIKERMGGERDSETENERERNGAGKKEKQTNGAKGNEFVHTACACRRQE